MKAKLFVLGLVLAASGCQASSNAGNPIDAATSVDLVTGDSTSSNPPTDAPPEAGAGDRADRVAVIDTGVGGEAGDVSEPLPSDDPGTGAWVPVPPDQVSSVCHLDPQKLADADAKLKTPWAIVRYGLQQGAQMPGPCAPVSVYPTHPHGLSTSPDCNYAAPYSCNQPLDVGVWQAIGRDGNVIQGHPGLDIVIAARLVTPGGLGPPAAALLWDAVRPAIVAGDGKFAGDDAAFCAAYGKNTYAPDLH